MVAATVLMLPGAASAHGVGGSSDTIGGFVWLGTKHMLAGWDHLLFVGGILLLAGGIRRAAKLISLFALGHSITIFTATATATVADWHVNPVLVDIVVALSLVFVGVVGLRGRPRHSADKNRWCSSQVSMWSPPNPVAGHHPSSTPNTSRSARRRGRPSSSTMPCS